ncbi:major facilitator superfamily MFS_1 [Magnetococcus marinus MC-1]|uniref:Major facilitator superfamily MFS_1 n=1 Tax=Magnetococcus marinus (strain ATCC BAA-1437 / JCM 17883 / MC-1) TaxID=156889 RepID=A0L9X7_MAGMM|nr:magnetosome biogenesis transporter MamH [Magnetococcus marinus]ABK44770.1 major facilitator superfamily MFS_1 [Magnetococcus marinus MC-1]
MRPTPIILERHHNTLYLIVALTMVFMTLVLATQPLYLRNVLQIGRENAGFVNANIQVITEVLDLVLVGYLGYLSDRFGRIPIIFWGFVAAGVTALLAPMSGWLGVILGIDALAIYYLARILMSLGTAAVWPQLSTLTGDYTTKESRPVLLSKVAFMMAFGATLVYAVLMQLPNYVGVEWVMVLPAVVALLSAWLVRHFLLETSTKLESSTFPLRRVVYLVRKRSALQLSFLAAFTSRNDMVLIGLFLMTWFIYFGDLVPGVDHNQAAARAGFVIGFIGVTILLSIPFWGWFIRYYGRVEAVVLGLLLSGVGFLGFGLIINPMTWWSLLPALFVGLGQAGCLVAPQILALDNAEPEIRGSIMGAFNTAGCIGIIVFLQIGGFLFDYISPTAPLLFTGFANLLIMFYGLAVKRWGEQPFEEEPIVDYEP